MGGAASETADRRADDGHRGAPGRPGALPARAGLVRRSADSGRGWRTLLPRDALARTAEARSGVCLVTPDRSRRPARLREAIPRSHREGYRVPPPRKVETVAPVRRARRRGGGAPWRNARRVFRGEGGLGEAAGRAGSGARAPARPGAVDGRTNRIASLSSTPGGTPVSMRCSRPNRRRTGPSGIVRVEGYPLVGAARRLEWSLGRVDAEFGSATGDGSTAVGCVGAAVVVPGGAVDPAVAAGFAVGGEGRPPTRRASVSDSRPRGLTWAGSKSGRATSTPGCFKCRRRVGRLQPGRVVSGPGPYPPASVPWILQKRCRPCSRACVPS